jgi:hypothetical protein
LTIPVGAMSLGYRCWERVIQYGVKIHGNPLINLIDAVLKEIQILVTAVVTSRWASLVEATLRLRFHGRVRQTSRVVKCPRERESDTLFQSSRGSLYRRCPRYRWQPVAGWRNTEPPGVPPVEQATWATRLGILGENQAEEGSAKDRKSGYTANGHGVGPMNDVQGNAMPACATSAQNASKKLKKQRPNTTPLNQ